MKTNLLRLSLVPVLAVTAAFAQNVTLMEANIPFDFTVGQKTLPAGRYTVDRGLVPTAVVIRSEDSKKAVIVIVQAAYSNAWHDTGSLVFDRYGSSYFLSQIWTPGRDGRSLPPGKREREMAARLATPVRASVAATR